MRMATAGGLPATVTVVCAPPAMYGVTVYEGIVLPPFEGAVQLRLTAESAGLAVTPTGAPGAVGAETVVDALKTTVFIDQYVFFPVPTLASGASPAMVTRSSTRS